MLTADTNKYNSARVADVLTFSTFERAYEHAKALTSGRDTMNRPVPPKGAILGRMADGLFTVSVVP